MSLSPTSSRSGTGGSSPSTATATVTSSASVFYVVHTFDLGHVALAYIKATVLALTPDGETFGSGAGDIQVDVVFDGATAPGSSGGVSRDGVTFVVGVFAGLHVQLLSAVNGVIDGTISVPRFVRPVVAIVSADTGDLYAGANHPTAQVRIDVEYV